MENATKALIMAATILISIAVISLGLYLATTLGAYSSEIENENRQNQIEQFNVQFLSYQGKETTIYNIITLANLANENNKKYGLTRADASKNTLYISVDVKYGNKLMKHFEEDVNTFTNSKDMMEMQVINQDGEFVLRKYKCIVEISDVTQRVYKVSFQEI